MGALTGHDMFHTPCQLPLRYAAIHAEVHDKRVVD